MKDEGTAGYGAMTRHPHEDVVSTAPSRAE